MSINYVSENVEYYSMLSLHVTKKLPCQKYKKNFPCDHKKTLHAIYMHADMLFTFNIFF